MPPAQRVARTWSPTLTALIGIVFFGACYYPGAMSLDSAVIWSQARGAPSTNIYGAGLRWLWQSTDTAWTGPGGPFLIQLALFWSGLALIAGSLECGTVARIGFMLAAAFAPVVFVLLAHVWTDVTLFAALAFAVGALLRWRDERRPGWLVAFWLALAFTATLRHNVLPAVAPLVAYCVHLHLRSRGLARAYARTALVAGVAVLCLGLQAIGGLSALSAQRRFATWPATAMWDLAAMSIKADRILLPEVTRRPELTLDDLRAAYAPYANVPIFTATQGRVIGPFFLLGDASVAAVRAAWVEAVLAYPAAYAAHRWRLTRALFGSKRREWPHELVYVDDEFALRDNPSVAANGSALHAACVRVAQALHATVALAPWPYLVLGVASLVAAIRRRAYANAQAAIAVLASGLAYAAPLPLAAPSAELRYLGWTCLAAVIGTALMLDAGHSARTGTGRQTVRLDVPSNKELTMPASKQTFFIVVPDLAQARGQIPSLSYSGNSAESFAEELQAALREPSLWERWRSMQPDPDAVDPLLGASDAHAVVDAHQSDLHCDVKITTSLPHAVLRHRLGLLIGANWTLRDVSAA